MDAAFFRLSKIARSTLALMLFCSTPMALAQAKSVDKPKTAAKAAASNPAITAPVGPIEFSHNLSQSQLPRLQSLVDRFNAQNNSQLVLVAHSDGQRPRLLNLATPSMVSKFRAEKIKFRPLYLAMRDGGQALRVSELSSDLLVPELGGMKKPIALPVAFSTPVLFYDKAAFRAAGLNPDAPPKTWQELQDTIVHLSDKNHNCPYTSSWLTWVHIDNVSALAGEPVATKQGQLQFNGLPQVRHIARLSAWYKAELFKVFGNRDEADYHFAKRECAMLTSNSWAQSWLRNVPGLELGVAPLPHDAEVFGGRHHTLADGASLWIGEGYRKQDYQVAAKFVNFLLAPDVQIELARVGNFVPLTQVARQALSSRLFADESQTQQVVSGSLQGKGANTGIRLGAIEPVRAVIDEELSAVWANAKPAKAALDAAVMRGNAVLSSQPALKSGLPF